MLFMSKYLGGIETSVSRPWRNQEDINIGPDVSCSIFEILVAQQALNQQPDLFSESWKICIDMCYLITTTCTKSKYLNTYKGINFFMT